MVKPNSNFITVSSQNSCSTFKGIAGSVQCNPALFPFMDLATLQFQSIGKAEGDSVDAGRKLIFDPISKEFLESLFSENSLISFNFDSNINFYTNYFLVTYSPYYLIGDVYILNPAFPEISMFLNKQSSLKMTSGYDLSEYTPFEGDIFSVGMSLFRRSREVFAGSILLTDFAQDDDGIVEFEDKSELGTDIGFFYESSSSFLSPKISLQAKNLFTLSKVNNSRLDSSSDLETFLIFEPYSQLGLGSSYLSSFGEIYVGMEFPFDGVFESIYIDYISGSINYSLNSFMGTIGISKYFKTLGLYFTSDLGSVGIIYSNENELAGKNIDHLETQNSIYIQLDIKL